MKVLAFTDFHGNKEAYSKAKAAIVTEKPEFVIAAGDITNHDLEAAKRFLLELASAGRPVYFVPGNMDNVALGEWAGGGGVHALHGRCEYYQGIALLGVGGSPHGPFQTPFEYSEDQAAKLLQRALVDYRGGRMFFVPHCPPIGTKLDRIYDGGHAGSTAVRNFVEAQKPVLVISGHIHEAQGVDKIGSSVLVNTGPAQRGTYARIGIQGRVDVAFEKLF